MLAERDFSFCLRPYFTQEIAEKLLNGKTLNVFAPNGYGKGRLIEDLIKVLEKECRIIDVNMKAYQKSYEGLFKNLATQLQLKPKTGKSTFELVFAALHSNSEKMIFFIENLDAIFLPDTDKNYKANFFDNLNALSKNRQLGLLISTQHKIKTSGLYIEGKPATGSRIDTDDEELMPLKLQEIKSEFIRKLNHLQLDDKVLDKLSNAVSQHSEPYNFLKFIIRKIKFSDFSVDDEIEPFIKKWQKDFDKQNKHTIDYILARAGRWVDIQKGRTNAFFRMFVKVRYMSEKWKKIIRWSITVLSLLIAFIIKFWHSILALFK